MLDIIEMFRRANDKPTFKHRHYSPPKISSNEHKKNETIAAINEILKDLGTASTVMIYEELVARDSKFGMTQKSFAEWMNRVRDEAGWEFVRVPECNGCIAYSLQYIDRDAFRDRYHKFALKDKKPGRSKSFWREEIILRLASKRAFTRKDAESLFGTTSRRSVQKTLLDLVKAKKLTRTSAMAKRGRYWIYSIPNTQKGRS